MAGRFTWWKRGWGRSTRCCGSMARLFRICPHAYAWRFGTDTELRSDQGENSFVYCLAASPIDLTISASSLLSFSVGGRALSVENSTVTTSDPRADAGTSCEYTKSPACENVSGARGVPFTVALTVTGPSFAHYCLMQRKV